MHQKILLLVNTQKRKCW